MHKKSRIRGQLHWWAISGYWWAIAVYCGVNNKHRRHIYIYIMKEESNVENVESTAGTLQCDIEESTANADPLAALQSAGESTTATLQSKLTQLQAKLHKEFRWYCDTILQGGSLAVRVAYRVHCAVETIEIVDAGEVRDDPAFGEPMCYIGMSLYSEEDLDKLLDTEYLLDDLYDAWCSVNHSNEEWGDTVNRYLDIIEGRYPNNK